MVDSLNRKIKVGIAGYGIVGERRHKFIEENQNLEVVAICDKNFMKSFTRSDGIQCFTNTEDLLAQNIDALFVCLTNDVAASVTANAINLGIHVFCEKPPGSCVADIKKVLVAESNKKSIKLMYGFNHRFHYSIENAINIINSGEYGEVISLRGVYGKSKMIPFTQSDWRTKRSIAGGGILLDQGIHMLDLMRLFSGEFTKIYSFISNRYWKYDVEDNAYVMMKTEKGIVATLISSATQWRHKFNLEINMEKATIILGGILSSSKSYGEETLTIIHASHDSNSDHKEVIYKYTADDSWKKEIDYFEYAISNNQPIKRGSSADALKTMELVFKIYDADSDWSKYVDAIKSG